jgi:hypothetical protein
MISLLRRLVLSISRFFGLKRGPKHSYFLTRGNRLLLLRDVNVKGYFMQESLGSVMFVNQEVFNTLLPVDTIVDVSGIRWQLQPSTDIRNVTATNPIGDVVKGGESIQELLDDAAVISVRLE